MLNSKHPEEYKKFIDRFVFRHDLFIYRFFDFIMRFMSLASSYWYIYMAAFRDLHKLSEYDMMFKIATGVEGAFLLHMMLQMIK